MEFASRLRWILVIVVVVIALILIGWFMFSIAQSIFDGGSSNSSQESTEQTEVTSAATAFFTTQGPVVANSEQQSYTIEVSQNVVSMRVYRSYGQVLETEKSYQNTLPAYDAFLKSLDRLNVTARKKGTTVEDDYNNVGVCAKGKTYIFELDSDLRRWSTACSKDQGTANFNMTSVRSLFQKQVPDYNELVSGTGL